MADWLEWITSCIMSLIFAYMVTRLISIVHTFRKDDLRVQREHAESSDSDAEVLEERDSGLTQVANVENLNVAEPPSMIRDISGFTLSTGENTPDNVDNLNVVEPPSMIRDTSGFTLSTGEHTPDNVDTRDDPTIMPSEGVSGIDVAHAHAYDAFVAAGPLKNAASLEEESDKEESLLSDDEDWEGIAGSELDKAFGRAAAFLEKMVLDTSVKMSNDRKLQFYGLYKQATEGPCSSPQPSAYRLSARAKWNAWKSLRDVSPEEAMQRYVNLLSELFPDWNQAAKDEESAGSSEKALRMGPVFSTMLNDALEQEGLENLHKYAKEGNLEGLEILLQSNSSVDQRDVENRTALHWASDQGHLDIVKLLISRGAEINAKDSDGQTALHYAVTCEWEEIAAFLLENGADPSLVDNEGCRPYGHSLPPHKDSFGGQDIK